jgi:N6-adenosine-specific RNA methylase IME4
MALGLIVYLIGLAKWARHLQEKNATIRRKQIYGVIAAVPMLAVPFYSWSDSGTENAIVSVWCFACAILGYVTVVYRPKWIVGNR